MLSPLYRPCQFLLGAMITSSLVCSLVYFLIAFTFYADEDAGKMVPLVSTLFGYKIQHDSLSAQMCLSAVTAFTVITSIFGFVAIVTAHILVIIAFAVLTLISAVLYISCVPFFQYQWIQFGVSFSITLKLAFLFLVLSIRADQADTTSNSSSCLQGCCQCGCMDSLRQFAQKNIILVKCHLVAFMSLGLVWSLVFCVLHIQYVAQNDIPVGNRTVPVAQAPLVRTIYTGQISMMTLIDLVAVTSGLIGAYSHRFILVAVYARLSILVSLYLLTATGNVSAWRWITPILRLPAAILAFTFAMMLVIVDLTPSRESRRPTEAKEIAEKMNDAGGQ